MCRMCVDVYGHPCLQLCMCLWLCGSSQEHPQQLCALEMVSEVQAGVTTIQAEVKATCIRFHSGLISTAAKVHPSEKGAEQPPLTPLPYESIGVHLTRS